MKLLSPLLALFLLTSFSQAIDPPEKLWERTHTNIEALFDIELVSSGGFICAGYDEVGNCIFRFNDDADLLWAAGSTYVWRAEDVDELPDGTFIATGANYATFDDAGDLWNSVLFIQKYDQSGNVIWTKTYSGENALDEGFNIMLLPDGGFAVCGKVNGVVGSAIGNAWILRTDANGDTLWTDIQGTHTVNFARGIEYDPVNDWIVVCIYGRTEELINRGPHLLYYSLDGEYLFGTTYPELYPEQVRGFCPSSDGGYAFLSRYGTGNSRGHLVHTDNLGNILWTQVVPAVAPTENDNLGLSFALIDGGYICCGWDGYGPWPGSVDRIARDSTAMDDPSTQDGSLDRYDAYGNEMWHISNEVGGNNHFYSAVQLPQGGYMAAGTRGGNGYLVRYAPETGIGEGEPSALEALRLGSNPFSSSLSVSYSLPEAMQVTLSVYDITGRMVGELEDGVLDAGEHTSVWDSGELPSGCYVVTLRTVRGVFSRYATLIK